MTQIATTPETVDNKGQELIQIATNHSYVPVIGLNRMTELKAQASAHLNIETPEAREKADEFVKMAKKEHKSHSDNRLTYTRKLNDIISHVSAPEKELEAALKPVEAAINNQLRREEQARQEEQRRIAREAQEREEAIRKENERIANLKSGVARLKTEPVLKMEAAATLAEFNIIVGTLEKLDCKATYGEFAAEAAGYVKEALGQVPALKTQLEAKLKAARENAEEAARQEQERKDKQAQLERQQKEEQDRIAAEKREADMRAAEAADMQRQAQEQALGSVTGAKTTWKFEVLDLTQVPREFFILDEKKVAQAIKDGEREIAGLRIYPEVSRSGR